MFIFFFIDLVLLTLTAVVRIKLDENWSTCKNNFKAWGTSIIVFMVISLLLNFL